MNPMAKNALDMLLSQMGLHENDSQGNIEIIGAKTNGLTRSSLD